MAKGTLSERLASITAQVKRLLNLYLDSAKLTLTEKLTILLSAGVVLFVCLVLGVFCLAFLSGACIELLAIVLPLWACYAIMAGVIVVLTVVTLLLRKPLIENPISRFISRLVFDEPEKITPEE